ncbi:AMP-binding protein, partial [candidate division WOR-3 bacterium]|nr:AMP-binding protein [candidate division WOR-3 bacterium]
TQVDVSPDDIASIIFTSGTTGISKGVVLSHYNFLSDAILAEELLNLQEEDIFLSVLPIHHTFEFTADFLDPIVRGNTIVYARSLKSKELLEDLKDSKATMLLGVPLLFEKLYTGIMKKLKMESALKRFLINYGMKKGKRDAHRNNNVPVRNFVTNMLLEKAGLSSLRVMIAGGAALRPDVEEGIRAMGIGIVQGYGLSEASPIVTINPPDRPKVGSIGLPIPGIEVKIFEPDREGIGEIIVRGPIVMKGYYRNIEETRKTIVDGWLHTGDMGYKDNDGYFYITGRKKSLIVTPGGKNVFPEEIEYKLVSQDLISEALVYGVYNEEKQGEEIKAVIYPEYENIDCPEENTECYENMIKEVVREINDGSPNYKRITHVEIRRDEFIKTTTRKIKRYMYEKKE